LSRRRWRPAIHAGRARIAIDAGTPIIVLVWNNRGYGEIKTYMEERGVPPEGVDLATRISA
jgi:acetolactate synthase-1/2/3 large subunit